MPSSAKNISAGNTLLIFLLLIAMCLFSSCQGQIKVNDSDIVYITRKDMLKELGKNHSKKHPIVIVDPRSPDEYMLGHIENAINIPLPQAQEDDPKLEDAKNIFIYGRYGEDPLAKAMCKKLLAFGYENVKMYKGGLEEWQARQLPITTGSDQ